MVTVANIVEKIIEQKPFIQEALRRGLINNAALATELHPLIEKELKKKIKFSAVNMAIRRLAAKLKEKEIENPEFDKDSDINLKSNLIALNIYKQDNTIEYLKKIYGLVDYRKGDFLTVTHGLHEVMIITNAKHKEKVLKIIPNNAVDRLIESLSSITIGLPESAVDNAGFIYIATRALAWENINIVDIVSTFNEMTFIVSEEDVPRSFGTLKRLLERKY